MLKTVERVTISRPLARETRAYRAVSVAPELQETPRMLTDRYQLIKHIADGGVGKIYIGYDHKRKKVVCLKVATPEMMLTEAGAQTHSVTGALPTWDIFLGRDQQVWMVMPFIKNGESLRSLVEEGKLTLNERLEICAYMALTVDRLEEKTSDGRVDTVIHGDISPNNFIKEYSVWWLLDFGFSPSNTSPAPEGSSGTPGFMAPEVICGEKPTHMSDLFSFVALTYYVLTGKNPFLIDPTIDDKLKMQSSLINTIEGKHLRLQDDSEFMRKSAQAQSWVQQADAIFARGLSLIEANRYTSAQQFITDLVDAFGNTKFVSQAFAMREANLSLTRASRRRSLS